MDNIPYPDNPLADIQHNDDLDSKDGFKSFLNKAFTKLSCASENKEHAAHDTSMKPKDFTENRAEPNFPPSDFNLGDTVYNFSHPKRGLAVIINNEDFSKSKDFGDRPGSSYDASALYHSFRFLGFDVMPYDNLSAWKMIEVLKAAAFQFNHKDSDCFACAILTHGDQILTQNEYDRLGTDVRLDLLFGSDGKAIATKAIVEIFNDINCPSLTDKPRLFFLQACRGDKYDHGQTVLVRRPEKTITMHHPIGDNRDAEDTQDAKDHKSKQNVPPEAQRQESFSSSVDPPEYHIRDATDAAKEEDSEKVDESSDDDDQETGTSDRTDAFGNRIKDIPVSPTPLYKDCLIMYATPPGHFAWRRRTGAWFVQSLCKVIDSDILRSIDLLRALTLVCGITARNYQSENPSNPEMHGKKETPVVESMLVKDVFIPGRSRFARRQ